MSSLSSLCVLAGMPPILEEKQREHSCCSSAVFEMTDAAAQMFAKETPAVISIRARRCKYAGQTPCLCLRRHGYMGACVHCERSVCCLSSCMVASMRDVVAIASPAGASAQIGVHNMH